MVIEKTLMKHMKSIGGITHGRGFTESVLNKWIFGLPVAYHVCENIEKFCGITSSTSFQHIELRDSSIKKDEKDVQTFFEWLQQHFPFTCSEDLMSISSGIVASEDINCHEAVQIGEKLLKEVVIEAKKFADLTIKRKNKAKANSASNSTVKVADEVVEIDTSQLLQRIICTVKAKEDLKSCFNYELSSFPLSIFSEKGLMRKTKNHHCTTCMALLRSMRNT
ncbi:uncharacterized protein LOC117173754 [Belonocnema kinseyi]|uniref:uncharacterized protein LOC117173754 n=1 Tax=Belonocnema kinseyi TaxID=2817044 RepID=UPI00143DA1B6|nr:uncharacterized protein LOC117173754 [Belonocnema kinseyi]